MDPNIQQPPQPVQATSPMQAPMPTAQPAAAPVAQTAVKAPKSNKKLLIILLLVLVLAAVVGGVAYFYVMGNKSANKQAYVPPQKQSVSVSPTPEVSVNSISQLDSAVNEVNGVSTTTMESEFNQAVTEAKSL